MYNGILQTDIVVWFGVREPDWEDWVEEEDEEFSLRLIKTRKRGRWSISKDAKKS